MEKSGEKLVGRKSGRALCDKNLHVEKVDEMKNEKRRKKWKWNWKRIIDNDGEGETCALQSNSQRGTQISSRWSTARNYLLDYQKPHWKD